VTCEATLEAVTINFDFLGKEYIKLFSINFHAPWMPLPLITFVQNFGPQNLT
jgi:hypothetical protein